MIGMLFLAVSDKQALRTQTRSLLPNRRDLEEQIRLAPAELTLVPQFTGVLLGDVLARRVPVSAFWRHRVSLQRKKCCQQIIGLND
jgi:hypothetical protein